MADCSAVGTTLDRATNAILGSATTSNPEASKYLAQVASHASAAGGGSMIPQHAPDHLVLPGAPFMSPQTVPGNATRTIGGQAPASMDAAWQASVGPAMMHGPNTAMHVNGNAFMMGNSNIAMHQQQHMQFMHMQHMMRMQQEQLRRQQIDQARIAQEEDRWQIDSEAVEYDVNEKPNVLTGKEAGDFLEQALEGVEDDFVREMQNAIGDDVATVGHPGLAQGATVEDLAAAWAQAEAEYDELASHEDPANLWSGASGGEHGLSVTEPYKFVNQVSESNQAANRNWMSEGMTYFREGNLKKAIFAFEMEIQQNNFDNSTAWRMLGRCHAENDQDPEAIKCLETAVDRDPYSSEALLALGVSYVNELNHDKALENLKSWITHNPKYAGMELPEDIYGASSATGQTSKTAETAAFEDVKSLLFAAISFDSTDAADVYEALGVVYNVSHDYDEAVDAFEKALKDRPDDYQLWNKLGATLANGNRSEDALPAYQRALQLKPKYARAWLNMAISHSNLLDHHEAARCYLQTLALNPSATHCWTYLRMAISAAEQWDLLPLVFSHDLQGLREHFDFVLEVLE